MTEKRGNKMKTGEFVKKQQTPPSPLVPMTGPYLQALVLAVAAAREHAFVPAVVAFADEAFAPAAVVALAVEAFADVALASLFMKRFSFFSSLQRGYL